MVKFIAPALTLPLRSAMLRNGKPLKECIFPTDEVEGAFHLGFVIDENIVSIASFFPQSYRVMTGLGFQLRGMATSERVKGKGFGSEIIRFAAQHLREKNVDYTWCNARIAAAGFYQKMGFQLASDQFEIPDIGAHYEMILRLKKV